MDIKDNLRLLCGQMGVTVPPAPQPLVVEPAPQPVVHLPQKPPKPYQPFPGIDCYCPCDFRDLPVERGSVRAVLTDLPYAGKWLLPNVAEFAEWCSNALAPGGIMVTWYSHHHLDEVMVELGKHLHYQWILASPLYGTGAMRWLSFQPRFQLALVYSKDERIRLRQATDDWMPGSIGDLVPAGPRDKEYHKHQKTVCQQQYLIEMLTDEEDLVVDTCSGAWTTAVACRLTNRRFIGSDNDVVCLEKARERFKELGATEVHHGHP